VAKDRVSDAMRTDVRLRAGGCCEYCRSQDAFSPQSFSAEHVAPRSRGGDTSLENLAWSCQGCNAHKYAKTDGWDAATGRKAALFHPRIHRWREHFVWGNDATMIMGTTPTGRATVEELKLNRAPVMNLRRVLVDAGLHPPPELA
jgi:HNH endonuclease